MAEKQGKSDLDPAPLPSLHGMTPEMLLTIVQALGKTSAMSVREALRSERKENPFYPERSVFNPTGVFDDEGQALPPKVKLARDTFFVGVRLTEELLTPEEIDLCNRFTDDKQSRNGEWTATLEQRGAKIRLMIAVPSKTIDDRMGHPPFTHILRELLEGEENVRPEKVQAQLAAVKSELAEIKAKLAATKAAA